MMQDSANTTRLCEFIDRRVLTSLMVTIFDQLNALTVQLESEPKARLRASSRKFLFELIHCLSSNGIS